MSPSNSRSLTSLLAVLATVVAAFPIASARGVDSAAAATAAVRPWPDTSRGVHVFNDQLIQGMTDAQVQFAATHYAGTQKMILSEADRLRAVNPSFMILHYRLGLGLGFREVENGCEPTGGYIYIVEGNNWVREWPGNATTAPGWFFPWSDQSRVLNCDWGWYLTNLDDAGYRAYWRNEVLRQLAANDDDGVFMDSYSVPNYMGGGSFNPPLPDIDASFEAAWSATLANYLTWLQTQLGQHYIVPNVGGWINSRDATDYSAADALMLEGFALEGDASPLAYSDWQLQMNRVLGAVGRGQGIIAQTYVSGAQERMFALGSYLLVKGNHSYLNLDLGQEPEWWPEYDIAIGAPTNPAAGDVASLYDSTNHVYRRTFDNGVVLVNPTNPSDGSGATRTVNLGGTYYLAETSGGGVVPDTGIPTGTVTYHAVTSVTLGPYSAAVLLTAPPIGSNPTPSIANLSPSWAAAGGPAFTLAVVGSTFVPGAIVRWNGAACATTFVNRTRLSVAIRASDIAAAGTAIVTVTNPAPGGGLSAPQSFPVRAVSPTINVGSLRFTSWAVTGGQRVRARVYTRSGSTNIDGAIVTVRFIHPYGTRVTMSGRTNASGSVDLGYVTQESGTHRVVVLRIVCNGFTYNPAANSASDAALTIS